jgi:hypothetical protein
VQFWERDRSGRIQLAVVNVQYLCVLCLLLHKIRRSRISTIVIVIVSQR